MNALSHIKYMLLAGLLLLSVATGVVVSSVPAYASPIAYVAVGKGSACPLPDGGTGVVQSDGRTCCPSRGGSGQDASASSCLFSKYINPAIQLMAAIIGIAVVIAIVLGAIEYITSGGDPQRASAGKKRITNALIGLAAFLLLYAFLQFIVPGGFLNG